MADSRPLVLHVVYRFGVGGLESGVVNLINRTPATLWRHGVLALPDIDPAFTRRIERDDVAFVSLRKPPSQGLRELLRLCCACRELRPSVVHTRNLAALEAQLPAFMSGVPARMHGEHGRGSADLHLTSRSHRMTWRTYRPFVHHYGAVPLAGALLSLARNRLVAMERGRARRLSVLECYSLWSTHTPRFTAVCWRIGAEQQPRAVLTVPATLPPEPMAAA